jgi:hypothetical protein
MSAENVLEAIVTDQSNPEEKRLYDYYVYELRDPRNNKIFYVGMGQGSRIYFHGNDKKSSGHPKEMRIAEIKNNGFSDCLRVIIGSYETSEEAFAVEATLINWVYGQENLTNIDPGRHSWCLRPASQRGAKEISGSVEYPPMDGIDRPKPVRSFDGAYTQNQQQLIEQNDIEIKLNWLAAEIKKRKDNGVEELKNITVIGPNMKRSQDPELVLLINQTPVYANLKLQLTGKSVSFNLRPKSRSSREEFVKLLTEEILVPYDLTTKAGGVRDYVKAEPKGTKYCDIPFEDIDTIIMVPNKVEQRLSQRK